MSIQAGFLKETIERFLEMVAQDGPLPAAGHSAILADIAVVGEVGHACLRCGCWIALANLKELGEGALAARRAQEIDELLTRGSRLYAGTTRELDSRMGLRSAP